MALNKAQMEILSKLSRDELLDFIDMLQKNWWNLQNNYILYINNEYGEEAAVKAGLFSVFFTLYLFRFFSGLPVSHSVVSG